MTFFQTCLRVESGFLSFLEIFRGAEHNGKCLKTLTFTMCLIYSLQHFVNTHFCLQSDFLAIPRAQEMRY